MEGNELESLRLGPQVCRHLLEGVEGSCALVDVLLVHCGQSGRRWGWRRERVRRGCGGARCWREISFLRTGGSLPSSAISTRLSFLQKRTICCMFSSGRQLPVGLPGLITTRPRHETPLARAWSQGEGEAVGEDEGEDEG